MAVTLGLAGIVAAALVVIAFVLSGSTDLLIRSKRRHRLLVTLKTGETFDGLLARTDRRTFVLAACELVEPDKRTPVDGELIVARADVAYLQQVS